MAFFVLRFSMIYGDPAFATGPEGEWKDWRDQANLGDAIMVFFDVQKYPPSLQFTLVTLGIMLTLWPLFTRLRGPVASVLTTFGAVPFFFYLLHVYLIHVLAIAANAAMGRDVRGLFDYMINVFIHPERLAGLGFSLPWVYAAWIIVLALLYPLCRCWQQLKALPISTSRRHAGKNSSPSLLAASPQPHATHCPARSPHRRHP